MNNLIIVVYGFFLLTREGNIEKGMQCCGGDFWQVVG